MNVEYAQAGLTVQVAILLQQSSVQFLLYLLLNVKGKELKRISAETRSVIAIFQPDFDAVEILSASEQAEAVSEFSAGISGLYICIYTRLWRLTLFLVLTVKPRLHRYCKVRRGY